MSVSIRVDSDVLIATMVGEFGLEEGKRQMSEILRRVEADNLQKVLFDGIALTGTMSLMDRFSYAEFAAREIRASIEAGKMKSPKFAYALSPQLADPNRFGENVAVHRAVNLRVLDGRALARAWRG